MGAISKYVHIFGIQLKNNFVREAIYRTNFFAMVVSDVVWIAVEFSLFQVIYANTQSLAGWTQSQVYFFLGLFFASDAIFTTFFQRNFWSFSDLVNKGELDILLTKPANPVFLALTRSINLTGGFNVVMGIAIMVRYSGAAGFAGGWRWSLLIPWLVVGVTTACLVRFAFAIWVFWMERSWAMSQLYYQFFQFATKPDSLYPKTIRYIILTALPFAFIGSIPARALLVGLKPFEYVLIAGVMTMFAIFDVTMWRLGLRRYQSASS